MIKELILITFLLFGGRGESKFTVNDFIQNYPLETIDESQCEVWNPDGWCNCLFTSAVCNKVQFCIENNWKAVDIEEYTYTSEIKDLVAFLRKFGSTYNVLTKTVLKKISEEINNICSRSEDVNYSSAKCQNLYAKFFEGFETLLASDLEDGVIASLTINSCGFEQTRENQLLDLSVPVNNDIDNEEQNQQEESSEVETSAIEHSQLCQTVETNDDRLCPLCEFAMQELEKLLSDKETEEEIIDAMKQICSKLPATISDQCNNFITEFGDQLLNFILVELTTEHVCSLINVCPNTKIEDKCGDCHYGMKLIHHLLNMKNVKDLLGLEIGDVCFRLPDTWVLTCREFVDMNVDRLLGQLQELDLTIICDSDDVCDNQSKDLTAALDIEMNAINLANRNKCESCITTLNFIKKNSVYIIRGLDAICYFLPNYRATCEFLTGKLAPWIVKELINGIEPERICEKIQLCTTDSGLCLDNILNSQLESDNNDNYFEDFINY